MKTSRLRKIALSTAAVAAAGILLAGCTDSGHDKHSAAAGPTAASTPTASAVSDEDLGQALDKLVFQGSSRKSADKGTCLVVAVNQAGLSDKAKVYIVKTSGDDEGKVVEGLRKIDAGDAELLLSPQLRKKFDDCVDASIIPKGSKTTQAYPSPQPSGAPPVQKKPDLKPKYDVPVSTDISSQDQLTMGLVSMFSSYAQDEQQRQVYVKAGPCLAGVVFDTGFSQETLRFLAGGAPIGTGSVADYLPNAGDRTKWKSTDFTDSLMGCTTTAASSSDGSHS